MPPPFDCVYVCIAKGNADVEKALYQEFAKHRINPKREFFAVDARRTVKVLKQHEYSDALGTPVY